MHASILWNPCQAHTTAGTLAIKRPTDILWDALMGYST